jgi:WD40 repeat protein
LKTLTGHTATVDTVAVTPNGSDIVSHSQDQSLRVWNLATGGLVKTIQGHTSEVRGVAVTPDGTKAVSSSSDLTSKIWDLSNGNCLHTLHTGWAETVVVTADGKQVVVGMSEGPLRVWDLGTGTFVDSLFGHTSAVNSVAVRPGTTPEVVSASHDHTLRIWDLKTATSLKTLTGHKDSVTSVAVNKSGTEAVSGSWDGTVKVWNLAQGTEIRSMTYTTLRGFGPSRVQWVALTPDGQRVVACALGGYCLKIWSVNSGVAEKLIFGPTAGLVQIAVTPDGTRVVGVSPDGTLRVWSLTSPYALLQALECPTKPLSLALTPGSTQALVGGYWGLVGLVRL